MTINSLEGTLIASSLFGITALDIFDEVITSHADLNNFLIENGQPKSTTYPGCAIRCFILLCSLLDCSIDDTSAIGSFSKLIKSAKVKLAESDRNLATALVPVVNESVKFEYDVIRYDDMSDDEADMNITRDSMVKRIAKRARQTSSKSAKKSKSSYECEICGDSYDSVEKLKKHLNSTKVWNQGACFRCPKCARGFHTEPAVDKHVALAHPELLYDRTPAIEYNTGTGDVKWRCLVDGCQAWFDQHLSAQVHEVREHRDFSTYERNYQCPTCSDWFETTQEQFFYYSVE